MRLLLLSEWTTSTDMCNSPPTVVNQSVGQPLGRLPPLPRKDSHHPNKYGCYNGKIDEGHRDTCRYQTKDLQSMLNGIQDYGVVARGT
jgi:hypothetical protein